MTPLPRYYPQHVSKEEQWYLKCQGLDRGQVIPYDHWHSAISDDHQARRYHRTNPAVLQLVSQGPSTSWRKNLYSWPKGCADWQLGCLPPKFQTLSWGGAGKKCHYRTLVWNHIFPTIWMDRGRW
jgi:hypothetical protein